MGVGGVGRVEVSKGLLRRPVCKYKQRTRGYKMGRVSMQIQTSEA